MHHERSIKSPHQSLSCEVKETMKEKRKIRKRQQTTLSPKTLLNIAHKDLKSTLLDIEHLNLAKYLQSLSATEAKNYSL